MSRTTMIEPLRLLRRSVVGVRSIDACLPPGPLMPGRGTGWRWQVRVYPPFWGRSEPSLAGFSYGVRYTNLFFHFIALLSTAAVGTFFPQMPPQVAVDPGARDQWLLLIQERYGGLTGLFYFLGLFNLFRSLWFRLLLSLLIINVTICTINRMRSIWRVVFWPKVRVSDALFQKGPLRASLVAKSPREGVKAVQTTLLRRRYRLSTEREGEALYIRADENRMARLGSLISPT